jgi:hypothetical protein
MANGIVMRHISCNNQPRCKEHCLPYYTECDYIFQNILVTPAREGGTRIQWSLGSQIRDEGFYQYSLQVGNAGVDDAKAWTTIATEIDACCLIDSNRRLPGVQSFTHYRLKLETAEGIYYSRPLHTFGKLNYADWRMYESIIRAEGIRLAGVDGTNGTLLKRKISGMKCKRCRDFGTGEVKDAMCKLCYGTGWIGGYYTPSPCFYININPSGSTITKDVNMQGPIAETQVTGRAIAVPILTSGDVWVSRESSERLLITQIKHLVEVKGIPTVYQLGMDRLPFSDVVYSFSLE